MPFSISSPPGSGGGGLTGATSPLSTSGANVTLPNMTKDSNNVFEAAGFRPDVIYTEVLIHETCVLGNAGLWTAAQSGTGAQCNANGTPGGANEVGLWRMETGTTTTGRYGSITSNAPVLLGGSGAEHIVYHRLSLSALADGTDSYTARWGFVDSNTGAPVDGAWFQHDETTGNILICTASNSVTTSTNTGVAMPNIGGAAGNFRWFRVKVNAAATSVDYHYWSGAAWTSLGTITTNIPSGAGRTTSVGQGIFKSAGTTGRILWLDTVRWEAVWAGGRSS